MIFTMCLIFFVMLVLVTIILEFRRRKRITLLAIFSMGNVLYNVLTPALFFYAPDSVMAFQMYVNDAGLEIHETGLVRVILAACVFQLGILFVSCRKRQKSDMLRSDPIKCNAVYRAALFVGWIMLLLGLIGVVWLGVKYNGHLMGLYEISYFERSFLALENSQQAFLINLGMYGAAQLIVVYLLTDRTKLAVLILLVMTLHGIGMKSKFPVFWILLVFVGVVIGRRKKIFRMLLPIAFTTLVLATMSVLRGGQNLSELPQLIGTSWELIGTTAATPWGNDIPGPAAMTYYVFNSEVDFTIAPITDTMKILIPKAILDRGMLLSEIYAKKMIGSGYMQGLGFGWPLICDGFLLLGWPGVGLFSTIVALLARYVEDGRARMSEKSRDFLNVVCYSFTPFALYSIRESMGGLVKAILVMAVLIWLPTWFLASKRSIFKRRKNAATKNPEPYQPTVA
jgi:hypothetical protein